MSESISILKNAINIKEYIIKNPLTDNIKYRIKFVGIISIFNFTTQYTIPKILIRIFLICGTSNSLNDILNLLLIGFNKIKSKVPMFIISGSLFNPGTIEKVKMESIKAP